MQTASEIAARATAWLIRLDREGSMELWEELQQWLDSHPRHRAEFIRQRTAWNRCDKLKILRPADGTIDAELLSRIELVEPPEVAQAARAQHAQAAPSRQAPAGASAPGRGRRAGGVDLSRRGWLAAAAVTGLAILGAWALAFQDGWQTYITAIGGRQQITLSDGSRVELNTDSMIRVRINNGRRDIVLTRGEALFRVAHDTNRPFFVTAAATLVRAVGTAFSVRIRADNSVDVYVTEGRVAVGSPRSGPAGEPELTPPAAAVAAGEAAAVSRGRLTSKHLSAEEMARKLAWTDPSGPHLSFWGETLSEMVGEFNRYNVRHLSIVDPRIQQIRFGGNFKASDLDGFVETLKSFHVIARNPGDPSEVRLIAAPQTDTGATIPPLEESAGVSPNHAAQRAGDR
jgi:transmembrane sensor